MGAMMDGGLHVDLICCWFAGYCLLSGFMFYLVLKQYRSHRSTDTGAVGAN